MALSDKRWQTVTESRFDWERSALDFLQHRLSDSSVYRAWSNFAFIAHDGSINEVDLLLVGPRGCFLIEIKSTPGTLEGDAATFIWTTPDGRHHAVDNPRLLANRKAQKLKSLLQHQKIKSRAKIPFIAAAVYCSANGLKFKLQESACDNVFISEPGRRGIIEFLSADPGPSRLDPEAARAVEQALDAICHGLLCLKSL